MIEMRVMEKGEMNIDDKKKVEDKGIEIGKEVEKDMGERRGIVRYE